MMLIGTRIIAMGTLFMVVVTVQGCAQPAAKKCIDVSSPGTRVTVSGQLVDARFVDEFGQEQAYVLQLPRAICIDDGGGFADPGKSFSEVHLGPNNNESMRTLRRLIGRKVTVSGEGFASHTRHHHRPLVVIVNKISED